MKPGWKEVRLGEVLMPARDTINLSPDKLYKQVTIRMNHKGVCERGLKLGSEIGSNQFSAKTGQFIISRIDARNGAMGIVPDDLSGAVVTNDFLLFDCSENKILPPYLDYLSHTHSFDKDCKQASEGTTNRVRLQTDKFYNINIPLPPLAEQQRIVAKLDVVKTKLVEVERLRTQQSKDVKALLFKHYTSLIENADWLPMREIAPITRRAVEIDPDKQYPELGIRSFGKGTFHKPPVSGLDVGTKKLFQVKADDLMFSNVFAWEGAIAVATQDDDERVGSHRFISCVADPAKALPEFLCYHMLTPSGMEAINAASPGGAGRNKTLGLEKLERILVPVPSLPHQAEFLALRAKLGQMQRLHAQNEVQLGQLIPSLLARAFGEG